MVKKFLREEEGQGMVEYILIVALIAVAAIAAVRLFGDRISSLFSSFGDRIENEGNRALNNR